MSYNIDVVLNDYCYYLISPGRGKSPQPFCGEVVFLPKVLTCGYSSLVAEVETDYIRVKLSALCLSRILKPRC